MYLEQINGPKEVKALGIEQLYVLSQEIREALVTKLSVKGGHAAPNLGMVEATIALHYVFDSPNDKLVFDISHQSYVHKMLTGRKDAFLDAQKYSEVSGYSQPKESEHDFFIIGHTSTSVSLALGLAKGRDVQGEKHNVIAIIGDGSLSGGEALEGLNAAAELGSNFIIVVNDNQMSIAENHGGLYASLKALRETQGQSENNLFRAFDLDYVYVDNGHDIAALIDVFTHVKDINKPIVVHINTEKGRGFLPATNDKETWHYHAPFKIDEEMAKASMPCAVEETVNDQDYGELTAEYLLEKMRYDERIVAITSGTPGIFGFSKSRRQRAGNRFVDVGIAEEHAVAFASGIAKAGGKPVYGVVSSFIQRTYDQLSQDLCINNNPATILVFWGSISSMNDVTHTCFYDIPLLCNIPNLVYLAPTSKEEYFAMLEWSINQKEHPVAIKVPHGKMVSATMAVDTDYSRLNTYQVASKGKDVAILGLGNFFSLAMDAAALLKEQTGIEATVINPRYITGIDETLMDSLKADHRLVLTLEDGAIDGGFGEKIARYYGLSAMKVLNYGAPKAFADGYSPKAFLRTNRLAADLIVEDIIKVLGK